MNENARDNRKDKMTAQTVLWFFVRQRDVQLRVVRRSQQGLMESLSQIERRDHTQTLLDALYRVDHNCWHSPHCSIKPPYSSKINKNNDKIFKTNVMTGSLQHCDNAYARRRNNVEKRWAVCVTKRTHPTWRRVTWEAIWGGPLSWQTAAILPLDSSPMHSAIQKIIHFKEYSKYLPSCADTSIRNLTYSERAVCSVFSKFCSMKRCNLFPFRPPKKNK